MVTYARKQVNASKTQQKIQELKANLQNYENERQQLEADLVNGKVVTKQEAIRIRRYIKSNETVCKRQLKLFEELPLEQVPYGNYKGLSIEAFVQEHYEDALSLTEASWFANKYPDHCREIETLLLDATRKMPRDGLTIYTEAAIRARMLYREHNWAECRKVVIDELGRNLPRGVSGEVLSNRPIVSIHR